MKPSDFVHLHCHSTYSLLEALPSPAEIVERARELGQSAVGLADKGYTYGLLEFYKAARDAGVKPILGMETYVAARSRFDRERGIDTKRYPLTLLAESEEGYFSLLQLATKAACEGMYYKPRVDHALLAEFGKRLIALSGPISGAIPQAALAEDGDRITGLVEQYQSFFGRGNLYFELMDLPNVTGQAEVNQQLIKWGKELDVPLVVTCNAHYCNRDDTEAHDVLLCIQKNANISDPSRFTLRDSDFSMRPFEELEQAFSHVPEALENTKVIADRCNVALQFGTYQIPRFPVPAGKTEALHLRELCTEGLKKRYGKPKREHRERLDHELKIIEDMGFASYFLIVSDFIREAKRRGITVGPGRGSAAGSIVSYCLDITTLDPLEHGLLFERFLNPERITMPDIDVDFADTRRDEVLEYVREKYGADRVVQICTFGTLAARAAVKDVGRAFGVPFMEMNALAKLIPERPGTQLAGALKTQELKAAYEGNETYGRIIDAALKLEGKARHVSIHACGVIITPEEAVRYTALQRAPKDDATVITQTSAKPLEAMGLLKMDFLGLTNLTVIQTTLEIIERTRGEQIDIAAISLDDTRTYELFQRGETTGVFQFESEGMRRYLKQLQPTTFADITAMAALYRPGPMEWIPSFIKRKHGREDVKYLHPDLKDIFEETYGIGVYQEQILQLARVFAGYSLGEADLLRRAIGKKIRSELRSQREKFMKGSVKQGYDEGLASRIFDDVIMPFAGYGFPKAHSAGYARIAYETAYLKANYPVEFMAALLSSDAQRTDRVMIEIDECRAMGIAVLPPDINESLRHFTAVTGGSGDAGDVRGAIRFGLTAIKGIGESSVQEIIDVRDRGGRFTSIEDFARRVPGRVLNKKSIEALAKSGALDSLGERATFVEHFNAVAEFAKEFGGVNGAQKDLFSTVAGASDVSAMQFPPTRPVGPQQKLLWEKETLGLYVSSHPLAGLRKYIGKKAQLIEQLGRDEVGRKVKLAGIAEGIKKITTKKGDTMAILFLEDPTGKIEVTLFPRVYAGLGEHVEEPDSFFVVEGTVDARAGQLQMRANSVKRTTLERVIENAKESGFYDDDEARRGLAVPRRAEVEVEEQIEMVDEEGNVIAGETVALGSRDETEALFGPLATWILEGMNTRDSEFVIRDSEAVPASQLQDPNHESPITSPDKSSPKISVYTIDLPSRAPKKLLLELKSVLQKFPGREKVQLRVGEQVVPLPLTVMRSMILEQKVEEVIEKYVGVAVE